MKKKEADVAEVVGQRRGRDGRERRRDEGNERDAVLDARLRTVSPNRQARVVQSSMWPSPYSRAEQYGRGTGVDTARVTRTSVTRGSCTRGCAPHSQRGR